MYDYVIVGAGSAGCVVAHPPGRGSRRAGSRSSRRGRPTTRPRSTCRSRSGRTSPATGTGRCSASPSRAWTTAATTCRAAASLGGSSSLNAMIYIRGHRADYDEWAAMGLEGWGYDDVLPYFKRAEDNERGAEPLPRRRRPAERQRQPLDASRGRDLDRGRGRGRHPAQRGPQRRHAGGRRALPAHPARRPALQRRGRLSAPGGGARQRRRAHRRARLPDPLRGRARGRRGVHAPRQARADPRRARGHPRRRQLPLAAAADALRRGARRPADARSGSSRATSCRSGRTCRTT